MARIFISYRREDGIARAGRIYDRLIARYGETQVFMDLGKIATGADFEAVLDRELAACDVVIAIIGEYWLLSRKGRRRLEDPADFVRRELESALERQVHVLPVLVGEAKMPEPHELPPTLAEFAKRHATRIVDDRFDAEMDALLLDIEDPDRTPEDTPLRRWQRLRQQVRLRREAVLTGAVIVVLSTVISLIGLLDLFTLDTRLQTLSLWLGDMLSEPEPDSRVAIIAIDDATEQALGRDFDRSWRAEHGVLVDRLSAAGVRAIAFDMYFEQPSAADAQLVAALDQARARGTAVFVGMRSLSRGLPNVVPALRAHLSGAGLLCVGHRLAYATTAPMLVVPGTEGSAARSPPKRVGLGVLAAFGPTPSISLDEAERAVLVPDGGRVREIWLGMLEEVRSGQKACPALHPGEEAAQLIIRLSGLEHWRAAPARIKYEDVVLTQSAGSSALSADFWRGKIVLVGVTNLGKELERTEEPDVHAVRRGFSVENRYGVELHADVVSNLLTATQVHPLHWAGQLAFTIASVGVALLVRLSAARTSRLLRWSLILGSAIFYLFMVGLLCAKFHVLLNCVYHLTAFAVTYWLLGKLPALATR